MSEPIPCARGKYAVSNGTQACSDCVAGTHQHRNREGLNAGIESFRLATGTAPRI